MKRLRILLMVMIFGAAGGQLAADQSYKKKVYLREYTAQNTAIKSALFPGWGQSANHETTKGYVVSALFLASCGAAISLYDKSLSVYNDYEDKGVKDDALYKDYEQYHTASLITAGAAFGIWIYSITDAYLTAADELRRRQEQSWQILFRERDIVLAFQRRF